MIRKNTPADKGEQTIVVETQVVVPEDEVEEWIEANVVSNSRVATFDHRDKLLREFIYHDSEGK